MQQHDLLGTLVFGMLRVLSTGGNFDVMHNQLLPFVTDINQAGVSLHKGYMMMIGPLNTQATTHVGSFGAPVTELMKQEQPQP